MMGTYSREVICSSKLSVQFLLKIVQGVLSANAWVSFYEFDSLNYSVLAELLATLYKASPTEHRANTLFTLIYHGQTVEQISPYAFHNFNVIEPDKKHICEWLLKMYRFKGPEHLAKRLHKFLKTTKPFLNRAFGSELRIIRQIVSRAGQRRMGLEHVDE
jgi:hypothetical protein